MVTGPTRLDPERIPPVCRAELLEWDEHVMTVGRALMRLLAEGLGADAGSLEEATCLEGRVMVCHYYPPCPEPEMTVGTAEHTDPGVLTVLLQDDVGGLQVKRYLEGGESVWVDVKPVPGALVINVGDLMQVSSPLICSKTHADIDYSFQEISNQIEILMSATARIKWHFMNFFDC